MNTNRATCRPGWGLAPTLIILAFAAVASAADLSLDQAFEALKTYDEGQPNSALVVIDQYVTRISKDADLRPKTAERLAAIVADPKTSSAAKLFACQQLKLVAYDAQVPLLAKMLDDPKTPDMARIVLQTMPGEDATRALISALDRTNGDTLVGVINSVGARRATGAATQLQKLLSNSDPKVASAAAAALGKIGRPPTVLRTGATDPILACAEFVASKGEQTLAAAMYRNRWGADRPPLTRMTALAGMSRVAPAEALPWMVEALRSPNEQLQGMAAEVARQMAGSDVTEALNRELPNLKGLIRILILGTLAERGDLPALRRLGQAMSDNDVVIRADAAREFRRLRQVVRDAGVQEQIAAALKDTGGEVATLSPPPYGQEIIDQRRKQIERGLAPGNKLVCYLDCGAEARAESNGVTIRPVGGLVHQFPGSDQPTNPIFGTIAFDAPKIDFELTGLDPKKQYALGFSWWDFDGGSRVQSVDFKGGDPVKTVNALKDVLLPAYTTVKKGPAFGQLPIAPALQATGKLRVSVSRSRGPNAVVSELWLVETQPGSVSAAKPVLSGGEVLVVKPAAPVDLTPPSVGTKVLLVTGIDYPGHPWRQTAPVLKDLLENDPRLKVRIVEDMHALGSPQLKDWDVVILHFMNWETNGPGPAARENLVRFVQSGKGMLMTHFACGAWHKEWPEFKDLAGRVWFGADGGRQHDPHGTFKVEIADPEHPITKGMPPFETLDELYTCLTGDASIHVVAKATSKVDKKDYPMAFVLNYGKGRVFHTVLGHDARAYASPGVKELMRRGCAWAAGLSPVPSAKP